MSLFPTVVYVGSRPDPHDVLFSHLCVPVASLRYCAFDCIAGVSFYIHMLVSGFALRDWLYFL